APAAAGGGVAVPRASARRLHPARATRAASRLASLGYALPGAVIAVGVLIPLATLDRSLVPPLERQLGQPLGLLFTGSAVGLLYAYLVRFIAVSLQTVEARLNALPPSLDGAARALGVSARGALRRGEL